MLLNGKRIIQIYHNGTLAGCRDETKYFISFIVRGVLIGKDIVIAF